MARFKCLSLLPALVLSLGWARPALAQQPAGGASSPEEADKEADDGKLVDFGIGLLAIAGGNFIAKPSDKVYTLPSGASFETDAYPGFGGTTLGGGLMLDVRFIKLIGLEVDILRTTDKGSGDITFNNTTTVDITLEQSAWHVPVLAKLVIPAPLVRPMVFLGPEFVFPGDPKASADPNVLQVGAVADSYTMFTGGIGVEIALPLPAIDLRIPVALRGSYNPGVGDKLQDRIEPQVSGTTITKVTYRSEWQYQAALTAGVAAYF